MANEFYTLIVVPHAKARFRKFQISVKLTKWAARRGGRAGAGGDAASSSTTRWIAVEVAELQRLRPRTRSLSAKTRDLRAERGQAPGAGRHPPEDGAQARASWPGLEPPCPTRAWAASAASRAARRTLPSADIARSLATMETSVESLTEKSDEARDVLRGPEGPAGLDALRSGPCAATCPPSFGNRIDPFTGQLDFHPGIDISTPIGTKVQAPADGVVVSCGVKGGYGNADRHRPRLRDRDPLRPPGDASTCGRASGCAAET